MAKRVHFAEVEERCEHCTQFRHKLWQLQRRLDGALRQHRRVLGRRVILAAPLAAPRPAPAPPPAPRRRPARLGPSRGCRVEGFALHLPAITTICRMTEERVQDLQHRLASCHRENAELTGKLASTERQLTSTQEQLASAHQRETQGAEELGALVQELGESRADLEKCNDKLATLQQAAERRRSSGASHQAEPKQQQQQQGVQQEQDQQEGQQQPALPAGGAGEGGAGSGGAVAAEAPAAFGPAPGDAGLNVETRNVSEARVWKCLSLLCCGFQTSATSCWAFFPHVQAAMRRQLQAALAPVRQRRWSGQVGAVLSGSCAQQLCDAEAQRRAAAHAVKRPCWSLY